MSVEETEQPEGENKILCTVCPQGMANEAVVTLRRELFGDHVDVCRECIKAAALLLVQAP